MSQRAFMWIGGLAVLFLAPLARSQEVSPDTVNRAVTEKLRTILASQKSDLRVEDVNYRYFLRLPDGNLDWAIETAPNTATGQQSVPVVVSVNGQVEKKLRVPVTLKMEVKVPVARNTLQRGQGVSPGDLEWQTLSLTRPIPDLVRNDGEVLGLAATRRINPGEPLHASWFEKPMAVERGERVRVVVANSPGLQIEATAVALDKGRIGDIIQLRNPDSQMRYEARVLSPGTVQVGTW